MLLWVTIAYGQFADQNDFIFPNLNSPYSRFGLGDFIDQEFNHARGMAGLSAAMQTPHHLNLKNPASIAFLKSTVFEVGIGTRFSRLTTATEASNVWSGNLRYLALGFPLKNTVNEVLDRRESDFNWSMAFSLQPFSAVGYDLRSVTVLEGSADTTLNSLKGSGGTYRAQWTNAARYKNLALGLNLGYQFGNITRNRRFTFLDFGASSFATEFIDNYSTTGFFWELGAQYALKLKEKKVEKGAEEEGRRIIAGISGSGANTFSTESERLYFRDNLLTEIAQSPRPEIPEDTILFESGIAGEGRLPLQLTLGLTYEDINRLKLGMEYTFGNWSAYENDAAPANFNDTWRMAVGGEWIPDIDAYSGYLKKIRYRFGAFYNQDPRLVEGNQLKEFGVTLGLGFPLIKPRQETSFINFTVEAGRFGLSDDAIEETFVKMGLGFTLNDNSWFFKRKFN